MASFCAQYWGVPQNRRRIYLIADFNGQSAEEILFKSESLCWNIKKEQRKKQASTTTIEDGIAASIHIVYENHGQDTRYKELPKVCTTVTATYGMGGNNQPFVVTDAEVRRITPKECCRLQGFPDGWCDNLGTESPTDEELIFWDEVFETHRKVVGKSTKRKTENQLRKWLRDPHTDSAEYKMWGNGVALPNVHYLLNGIAHQLRKGDL